MRTRGKMYSVLVTVLLLAMLTYGCGGNTNSGNEGDSQTGAAAADNQGSGSAENVKLTFMGWQPDMSQLNDSMIPLIKEKYPTVTIQPQVLDWFAYWDKLTVETAAGAGPDIMAMDVDHIAAFSDYIEPLDDLATEVMGSDW